MKKLLIYLSVIGVSLTILPIQAEAGSWHKKKDRFWARHHGYSGREHYRYYRPYYYSRYQRYYGYQRTHTGITQRLFRKIVDSRVGTTVGRRQRSSLDKG
ncbi:MAG: hypothetical protein QOE96_4065 [Blastocatellia bacterium]|nr:hypothetical protein [Blastocatellia bacterium]